MTAARPSLLLTRPEAQSRRFAQDCAAALGYVPETVIAPVMAISWRDGAPDLSGLAGVILTSAQGARALARVAPVAGLTAHCVGDKTAEIARSLGMNATSASGAAEDLVAMLAGRAGPFLHVHGAQTRGDVASQLCAAGTPTRSLVLYDQPPVPLTDAAQHLLAGDTPVVAPLFSPRSAKLLASAARDARAPLMLAALSPAVAEAWSGPAPKALVVADRPDAASLLAAVARLFHGTSP